MQEDTEAWLSQAMARHQAGDLVGAAVAYDRILRRDPDHPDALHFSGLVCHQQGRGAEGLARMRRSIELRPDFAGYLVNIGGVLEEAGQLEEAVAAYTTAMELEPRAPDIHFNAGLVWLKLDDAAAALSAFETVVSIDPADALGHANRGRALVMGGRVEDGLAAYKKALTLQSNLVAAHVGVAQCQQRLGALEAAVAAYRQALALRPADASLHNNLGGLLRDLGDMSSAAASFRRAVELDPSNSRFLVNAARAALDAGDGATALALARRAVEVEEVDSDDGHAVLDVLHGVLSVALPDCADPALAVDYGRIWSNPRMDPQPLAKGLGAYLRFKLNVRVRIRAPILDAPILDPTAMDASALGALDSESLQSAATEPLLRALLSRGLNVDPDLEVYLLRLRLGLLLTVSAPGSSLCDLCAAVGLASFGNEYLWEMGPEERETVAALREQALQLLATQSPFLPPYPDDPEARWVLARVAMYEPLLGLVEKSRLVTQPAPAEALGGGALETTPGETFAQLWCRSVTEPLRERALRPTLPRLSQAHDAVSAAVREQYEENPYPRWLTIPQRAPQTLGQLLGRKFPQVAEGLPRGEFANILVAGCGTGYEPILLALSEPQANIVALDLSASSLAYAERRRLEAGIVNLRFVQGDLQQAQELLSPSEPPYDLVVCTGVLHHLDDPIAGWRALCGVLAPGGVMRISLYSERARQSIVSLRGTLGTRGPAWSRSSMHVTRRRILSAPPEAPVSELASSDDLFSVSAIRDLLFHFCEHRYTPADIACCLELLGLEFLGMEVSDPGVAAAFRTRTGLNPANAGLAHWETFEQHRPQTFPGMLQFWCRGARH